MDAIKSFLCFAERRFEEIVSGFFLCTMACCIMVQILLRYLFSAAAPWAEEIAVYSMIGAIYFGACLGVRERAHIRVSIFYNLLPPKWRLVSVIFADFLWLVLLALVLWQSVLFSQLLFSTAYVSPGLGIEQRWPHLIVPICILLMSVRMAQVYWRWYKSGAQGLPT